MESLLSEMEAAGGSCSADDCEASYEVTEVWVNEKKEKKGWGLVDAIDST